MGRVAAAETLAWASPGERVPHSGVKLRLVEGWRTASEKYGAGPAALVAVVTTRQSKPAALFPT